MAQIKTSRRLTQAVYLVCDLSFWFVSLLCAAVLRFEFVLLKVDIFSILVFTIYVWCAWLLVGFSTHLYRMRFIPGSMEELRALAISASSVTVIGVLVGLSFLSVPGVPRSTILISAPIFLIFSGGLRVFVRWSRTSRPKTAPPARRVAVYGAGTAAQALIPQLLENEDSPYHPVVLIDDAPEKANRWIRGVPMGGKWKDLSNLVERFHFSAVIVAIPSAASDFLSEVYKDASALGLEVVVLPSLREYLGGRRGISELRRVEIEDLIGRESVILNQAAIGRLLSGKRVLITGAGGSIGSELSRQISGFDPSYLILTDRDESGLLLASMGVGRGLGEANYETYLLDIRDKESVHAMFQSRKPDIVFHAAALKHLSFLESFPVEAWKTNVEGTLNILQASADNSVSVFVNISTDKAANAANVLGRSKKLGEQLTAWFGSKLGKPYVSVRFGNVLGSRGSLIPLLSEQISAGGPVTITDKKATRYFMSITEACQLVLQAAAQGEEGDVMVLDMGQPVSIDALAKRMIELSGRKVSIKYIGLRPGEKLHEDLLSDTENPLPSAHPKILRLKAKSQSPTKVLASKWA